MCVHPSQLVCIAWYQQQKLQAIATFSDAVRLCYSVADEATESILVRL